VALHDLSPQLRTRLRRVEKIVGLFVAVAAAVLLGGFAYYLYHTAERKGWFTPKCTYYTFVQSADGLHVGDPVLLMGFSVGEITVIDAEPPASSYNVFVAFAIKKPYYGYIWTDSKATITGGGLLGGRQLQVTKGRTGLPTAYEEDGRVVEVLVAGQKIPVEKQPQGVPLDPNEAPALAERAERLIAQLEESLPRIVERLEGTLGNVEQLTSRLDGVVEQTRPVIANLNTITANLRNPDGSLGEWILPRDLRLRLTATLEKADANLSVLSGTLENLDAITGSVESQLQSNSDLLGDASALLRNTDDLVQGMKRHWLLRSAFPQPEPGQQELRLEPLPGLPGSDAP
jgi:ABC-type transporter Mla subunit MlaD